MAGVAGRMMMLTRVIQAPRAAVWGAWMNAESLPKWWGPDGFSCRTQRIDLREGGEWVFDMIAPDGTVFPNHHRYGRVIPEARLDYALLWGENGPKHADAWAAFEDAEGATRLRGRGVGSADAGQAGGDGGCGLRGTIFLRKI
jgi:uncharacterized protein YndB with AHSA1/START domain